MMITAELIRFDIVASLLESSCPCSAQSWMQTGYTNMNLRQYNKALADPEVSPEQKDAHQPWPGQRNDANRTTPRRFWFHEVGCTVCPRQKLL
jgi:hypothetical protein